jgi:hypothetical protein
MLCLFVVVFALVSCQAKPPANVKLVKNEAEQKVDVLIDGQLFTSYMYSDKMPVLKKTVLYPLVTVNGNHVTRGFPLEARAGERVDHPHHIGVWFNYGDVNGIDFWNNSNAISESRAPKMGTIRHVGIKSMQDGHNRAELAVTEKWLKHDGTQLLQEDTRFVFYSEANGRVIERITTLRALDKKVLFKDNKEGMVAVRVTRALEHPTDEAEIFTDAMGKATEVAVIDNEGVTGNYLSSRGITGTDTWGKRAEWVTLQGVVNGENVALTIFDHPKNVGYPTYWHSRDYGLFSANPLGQAVFSKDKEVLNFELQPGESVTFRHRISLRSGDITTEQLNTEFESFAKE